MSFNLSEFIRMEMAKKNIKAVDLADALNKSPSYISKMLKNNIIPDYEDLKVIAKILDINYSFLLFQIGILDEADLKHIIACNTLKEYLGELLKVNDMEEEKVNAFINFLVTNKENLGDNLTDELLNNVKDALGENFIYPDYATPYTEDSYYGFKKIRNLRLATGEYVRSKFRKLPLYTALNNGPITGRDMGFDFSLLKEEIEPDTEVVWFKPEDKEYCYLVNIGQYKDKDKILFERGDAIYVGKYNYQEKTMVLTDIMNAVSREEDDTPIVLTDTKSIRIIGKVLFEFKAG